MINLTTIGVQLPMTVGGQDYYTWLAQHRCCVPGCGIRAVELHHTAVWVDLGRKWHHLRYWTVIPLCVAHHRTARYSVHSLIRRGGDHDADRTRREDQQLRYLGCRPARELIRRQLLEYCAARGVQARSSDPRKLAEQLYQMETNRG